MKQDLPIPVEGAYTGQGLAPRPTGLPALLGRLPKPDLDDGQRRTGRAIAAFLALLLLFTLIARGTAGATMPLVNTATLSRAEVVQQITATGIISSESDISIKVPEGLTIEEMLVTPGQKVAEGEALARFDAAELSDALARAEVKLRELQAQLATLQSQEAQTNSALTGAQQDLDWRRQDLDTAKNNAQNRINEAQSTLDAAYAERDAAEAALNALAQDDEAYEAAQTRLATAREAVTIAEAALSTARTDYDEAVRSAERNLKSAEDALAAQQVADANARQNSALKAQEDAASAASLQLDIDAQQQRIDELRSLNDSNATLLSPTAGTVSSITQPGSQTTGGAVVSLEDGNAGYIAEAQMNKSDADKLQSGAEVDVETSSGFYGKDVVTGTLLSISDVDSNGQCTLRIRLPAGEWKSGGSVTLRVVQNRDTYGSTIPLSALRMDNDSYYVLVVMKENGVLGENNVLGYVPVELIAKDNTNAAIEAPLSYDDEIVLSSSKPVASGDRVRLST